jgi:4-amino-4-deoxy-L-arabinose transferase-like glycosyltransferase
MSREMLLDGRTDLLPPTDPGTIDEISQPPTSGSTAWRVARDWLKAHRLSLVIGMGLLVIVGLVHWIGYDRYPGRATDDEGTYVSQAWAVQNWHSLAHYTYWYDHPPVGWITIAGYTWLTDAFDRLPTSVTVGREFMVWVHIVSAGMIYLLGRRLGWHRLAASAAVLLFGLSPLAVPFQRMVYLDNLAVMWALTSLAFATSRRRSLAAAAGSAICFAIAVLTKETILVLFPAIFLALWEHSDIKTRQYRVPLFLTLFVGLVSFYPLYAALKNELFEGPGHVSLIWAIKWQLFSRAPSGSLLDPGSDTYAVARSWLEDDPLLLGIGVILAPIGLVIRQTRAVTLALMIQVVMLFRNGYLPFPYVIGLLPFAALTIAGVGDQLCKGYQVGHRARRLKRVPTMHDRIQIITRRSGQTLVALAVVAAMLLVAPDWHRDLRRAMTEDHSQAPRDAMAYIVANIPDRSQLLVDDNLWTDLVRNGFDPNPIWFYKLDLDPAVRNQWQHRLRDIDYIVLSEYTATTLRDLPLVMTTIRHSEVVASFGDGDVTIRKVVKAGSP